MSFIEIILGWGWLFDVVTFFDNLKQRHGDDPGAARNRILKRACVLIMLLPFAVLGLGYLAANPMDAFDAVLRDPQTFDALRSTWVDELLGLLVLSALAGCLQLLTHLAVRAQGRQLHLTF